MTRDDTRRKQIRHYHEHAGKFDASVWSLGDRDNRNHAIKATKLAEALRLKPGDLVFEAGAGTGLHARWMIENARARYAGLDVSHDMLLKAHERVPGAPLVVADASMIPVRDARVDAAFCSGTLHHMADPWTAIAEMTRITKVGGRVAAMEPNWKFPSHFAAAVLQPEERLSFQISPKSMLAWMRRAGLRDVRLERVLYTPPKPRAWAQAFDRIDRVVASVPVLRRYSIMFLVSGTKP